MLDKLYMAMKTVTKLFHFFDSNKNRNFLSSIQINDIVCGISISKLPRESGDSIFLSCLIKIRPETTDQRLSTLTYLTKLLAQDSKCR
jgi:hypothetical protein